MRHDDDSLSRERPHRHHRAHGRWCAEVDGIGHRGGRRRGGRGNLRSPELRLVLLKLIADQPRHGYDLIRAVEELTQGEYAPSAGIVYPALSMLQDMSLIGETASEGSRRAFAVTADGSAELAANADEVQVLLDRLAALARRHGGQEATPIRRAMDNLRAVLVARVEGQDLDKDQVHHIASILDETAQRIERL